MHADEVPTDVDLVRRLLIVQFPPWSELTIDPVPSAGTDNALYRLGNDMVVRLPRIGWAVGAVDREQRWLPRLAPHLLVSIPAPVGRGEPGEGYPWPWSIYRWLPGESPVVGEVADPRTLAEDLSSFVTALQQVDTSGAPPAFRGQPLVTRDEVTRSAIADLDGMVDTEAVTSAWEEALAVPPWSGQLRWVHSDLAPGNLLLVDGRLAGVIDFSGVGLGDPACDLIVAWNLLPLAARDVFRTGLGVDGATWARGRGWALSVALLQLPYYHETNPALADNARHVIGEIVAGH